jgi:3',5'-cyclic-AMP phosphodiesterase
MQCLLAQLSDTHIRQPGELAYRRVDTSAFLARAVAAVSALPQPADAVVVTGDLTDSGRADEYAQLRALLAPLACPVYLMPGNHDDGTALCRAFPDHAELAQQPCGERACWAVDVKGLHLVALDSTVPRATHGELDDAHSNGSIARSRRGRTRRPSSRCITRRSRRGSATWTTSACGTAPMRWRA